MSLKSKFVIIISILFFLLPITDYAAKKTSSSGDLMVVISGFNNSNGLARIAVYNAAQAYDSAGYSDKGSIAAVTADIQNNKAQYTFKNLPYGEYGIKVFHDKDGSGRFRTNLFGIPSQGYGFSNNPVIKRKMPNYEVIKFSFDKSHHQQLINIVGE